MNGLQLSRWGLHVRLALIRFGWGNGIAVLMCLAGIAGWLWSMPQLRAAIAHQQTTLLRVQKTLRSAEGPAPIVQRPLAAVRLANFYDALGEKQYVEQQIKTLFAVAAKSNLTLQQAEYKAAFDKNGRYHAYQISLPVKGSYGAIRQFCEQTLLAIPFASLDEIDFKRDAIANRTLEAKLRFTLYLLDAQEQQNRASGVKDGP